MKRDFPLFYSIRSEHLAIHEELLNWARLVSVQRALDEYPPLWLRGSGPTPMFAHYRAGQDTIVDPDKGTWERETKPPPINRLEGWRMEKRVGQLPEKHAAAIRWHYVFCGSPHRQARRLGLTLIGLADHVHAARAMLKNRLRSAPKL